MAILNYPDSLNIITPSFLVNGAAIGNALTTQPLSQFASTTSSELRGVISDETGTGALVFANSPTLITPALGTPASGNLSNCTAYPLSALTGLGANVATFLGTPSSANLLAAITDETGTGSVVFSNSPTLTTPDLGTPSAINLTNATGLKTINGNAIPGIGDITVTATVGEQSFIDFSNDIATPSAPASTETRLFSGLILPGRPTVSIRTSNDISPLQRSLLNSRSSWWIPTAGTAGTWIRATGQGNGTYQIITPANTNEYSQLFGARYSNVATTANQALGQIQSSFSYSRARWGYLFFAAFGFETWTNGGRLVAGMSAGATISAVEPSTINNTAAFTIDSTDNGAVFFQTRDGSTTTRAATGFTAESGNGFYTWIYCAQGSSQYTWKIQNINTGAEASGTATATLPVSNTLQRGMINATNAALTAANAIQLKVSEIFVEA